MIANLEELQTDQEPSSDLRDRIVSAYTQDNLVHQLKNLETLKYPWSWSREGLLLHDGLVYVPDNLELRIQLVREHHDAALAGHPGVDKTVELLSRNYFVLHVYRFIKEYVSSCEVCSRAKPARHRPHGELAPLPVPDIPWKGITCDFITDLPLSNNLDSILVFVDRLTKMTHLVPCRKTTTAPEFAQLFLESVVRLHGLPESIVSDRGSVFTSHFWKSLANSLGINPRFSTAFHPQTDGQTERMNQTVEQYLRIYCNYQQDDWSRLLPLAEFAINNAKQDSTNVSPFYANYGYHPRFSVTPLSSDQNTVVPAAHELANRFKKLHETLVDNVKIAQDTQACYYDAKHKQVTFNPGDKVWLSSMNLHTQRPSKKHDWKKLGPFEIIERIGLQAYRLRLPESMKIHPVFHVSLLEPCHENTLPNHVQPPPHPVIIDNRNEWEVEEILDSRIFRRHLQYKVRWKGYSNSNDSWEPLEPLEHSLDLLHEFHTRYPTKRLPSSLRDPDP